MSLDAEDDESDGVIDQISPNVESDVWSFPGIRGMFVCHENDASKSPRIVASTIPVPHAWPTYSDFYLFSVELSELGKLDSADGNSDGTLSLRDAITPDLQNQWIIRFGHLAEGMSGLHVECIGDLDQDGAQDYAITIKQEKYPGPEFRTNMILLMNSDLGLIDELDGSKDNELDVSRLWPNF